MHEPTVLILTAFAAEPLHGYGVIQSVAALSAGEVKPRPAETQPTRRRPALGGT